MGSEFVLGGAIFLLVLASVLFMWQTSTASILRSETINDLEVATTTAAEKLVRTSGIPSNWSKYEPESFGLENITSLGLANKSRFLDLGKVERFMIVMNSTRTDNPCNDPTVSNYECNKFFLGLGRYEFFVNVSYLDGSTFNVTGLAPSDPEYLLSKRRNALLDGEPVGVTLVVWY